MTRASSLSTTRVAPQWPVIGTKSPSQPGLRQNPVVNRKRRAPLPEHRLRQHLQLRLQPPQQRNRHRIHGERSTGIRRTGQRRTGDGFRRAPAARQARRGSQPARQPSWPGSRRARPAACRNGTAPPGRETPACRSGRATPPPRPHPTAPCEARAPPRRPSPGRPRTARRHAPPAPDTACHPLAPIIRPPLPVRLAPDHLAIPRRERLSRGAGPPIGTIANDSLCSTASAPSIMAVNSCILLPASSLLHAGRGSFCVCA